MRLRAKLALMLALAIAPASAAQAQDAIHMRSVGSGPRCWVLLHPFGASGRFWERRAATLSAAHGIRVYYPDLPSHGASRIVPRFDYSQATASVADALQSHCPMPQVVVGASSGGIVAMKLGARTGARVVGIGVGWSFSAANLATMAEAAVRPNEGLSAWLANFAEQGSGQVQALLRHHADLAASGTAPFLSNDDAAALSGRLLVLQGANDDFFLAPSAAALVTNISNSEIETFPDAGHLGPLAEPHAARTWQLIHAFAAKE
jgi:pimeloyl-ACP methyl ester carboxylesterase